MVSLGWRALHVEIRFRDLNFPFSPAQLMKEDGCDFLTSTTHFQATQLCLWA